MGLLKKLAGSGMFGLVGLAATHKLGGLARAGVFGIGGAMLAKKKSHPQAQAAPGASPMPQDFAGDPQGYQAAMDTWIQSVSGGSKVRVPGTGIGGAAAGRGR